MEIKVLSNFRACWTVAAGKERAGAAVFHMLQNPLLFCMRSMVHSTQPVGGEQPAKSLGSSFQAFSISRAKT